LFSFCKIRMHWFLARHHGFYPKSKFKEGPSMQWPKWKKWREKNNDLQNTKQKIKDRGPWTSLKIMGEIRCSIRVSSSCSTCGTHRVTFVTNPVTSHEWGKTALWLRQMGNIHVVSYGIDTITNVMVTVNLSMFYAYISLYRMI